MGTVLSFSPREKNPPYAVADYANSGGSFNNGVNNKFASAAANGGDVNSNHNHNGVVSKPALSSEKAMKKHSVFLNALSWKKFSAGMTGGGGETAPSSSKKAGKEAKAAAATATAAAMASRQLNNGAFPQVRITLFRESERCSMSLFPWHVRLKIYCYEKKAYFTLSSD